MASSSTNPTGIESEHVAPAAHGGADIEHDQNMEVGVSE